METKMSFVPYGYEFRRACSTGWGCGYVHIPKDHPILVKLITDKEDGWGMYLQPEGAEQEITYSSWEEGGEFYKIGFDTAHSYNDASNDRFWVIEETKKIKALVDAYTLEDAIRDAKRHRERVINEIDEALLKLGINYRDFLDQ